MCIHSLALGSVHMTVMPIKAVADKIARELEQYGCSQVFPMEEKKVEKAKEIVIKGKNVIATGYNGRFKMLVLERNCFKWSNIECYLILSKIITFRFYIK